MQVEKNSDINWHAVAAVACGLGIGFLLGCAYFSLYTDDNTLSKADISTAEAAYLKLEKNDTEQLKLLRRIERMHGSAFTELKTLRANQGVIWTDGLQSLNKKADMLLRGQVNAGMLKVEKQTKGETVEE